MKRFIAGFIFSLVLFSSLTSIAQNNMPARHKIALFAPLYLDSAFDARSNYRFDKTFPKFLNPGLEFYEGAQAALDSLNKVGAPLDVYVYDTRGRRPLSQQVNAPELKDVDLMIGHATTADVRILANAANQKKIPFVSASLPNDAGISNNPYYVVLNSTLKTHVEGIYRYLQKYHSLDKIIVFKKRGAQEEQIKEYLQDMSKSVSVPLKLQFEEIGSDFTAQRVTSTLDSNYKSVCIAGSLDENFGSRLLQTLAPLSPSYPLTVVGMPTWDGLNLTKSEWRDLEVIYTTPFYYSRWTSLGTQLTSDFEKKINARPTDMYYRGYETMLRFALLLLDTGKDLSSNLSRKGNYIFTQFDIQPVFLNNQQMELDYFENKKLYFVKTLNGIKTAL